MTSPLDTPDASGLDRQAARTLAEHLPQGYTADLAREQQPQSQPTRDRDGDESAVRPEQDSTTSVEGDSSSLARGSGGDCQGTANTEGEPAGEGISSLQLQGGDVHRSLFKMAEASARMQQLQRPRLLTPSPLSLSNTAEPALYPPPSLSPSLSRLPSPHLSPPQRPLHRRSATYSDGYNTDPNNDDIDDHLLAYGSTNQSEQPMPVRDLMAPQGFRRDFVQQQIRQRQLAEREATMQRRRSHLRERRDIASYGAARMPIARNFVEFLELYGHFADEDLEASDDDDDDDDDDGKLRSRGTEGRSRMGAEDDDEDEDPERGSRPPNERQPLLNRSISGAGGSAVGEGGKAKADISQAFFTLLKAFVGTGIMFLPKAYNNGGMVFSTVTLFVVSLMSMAGFQLLLSCRKRCGGGYGDIGLAIAGPRMRSLILGSITLSQLGFVCAGIVFAAENLASFASAVAHSHARLGGGDGVDDSIISTNMLIAIEVAVLIPLGFVRDIARLGPAALLGDVFIAIGLVYMYSYDLGAIAARGWHTHETVQFWVNPSGYALTIGAAIFTFEGIGLILPIQSSMARPERFGFLLCAVMLIITVAYISVGALGYAAFGAYTKTEVIDNYPRGSALVQAVQFLYAIAVLSGMPVQLFPAVRIIEGKLFGTSGSAHTFRSGKRNPRIKWAKNSLRAALVVACGAVAVLGAGHLDQFVALIGSVACVPLLFIYPPLLHYLSAGPESSAAMRAFDISLVIVGTCAMVFTTVVTINAGL